MPTDKAVVNTGQAEVKSTDARNGITVALITIVPATITAIAGFIAGTRQPAPIVVTSSSPAPIVKNLEEEVKINKVRGVFTAATPDQDKVTIHCKGSISNLIPDSQRLWIAVEVNGHIWFKRGEFAYNAERTSWAVSIREEGSAKTVSLLLYVVTKEADAEIQAWLTNGENNNGKFKEITSIQGAYPIDHFNNLQVRN